MAMQSHEKIAKFWKMPKDVCWACRTECPLERAHIEPRQNGGVDDEHNIHLLCSVCHKESEPLFGYSYFRWLSLKRMVFSKGGYYCDNHLGMLKQLNEMIRVGKQKRHYVVDESVPVGSLTEAFKAILKTELAPSFSQEEEE